MELRLTNDESRTLHDLLQTYLPSLEMEVARTDDREFRRLLLRRQELVERLIQELNHPEQ
jgi:hypothetical protein